MVWWPSSNRPNPALFVVTASMDTRLIVSLIISIVFHLAIGITALKLFSPHPTLEGTTTDVPQTTSLEAVSPSHTQKFVITPPNANADQRNAIHHTVKRGESLWVIAKEYKVSIEEIMDANGLSQHYVLKVGDTLKIPH